MYAGIWRIDLSYNYLTGALPPGLGRHIAGAEFLYLNNNMLTGPLPPTLTLLRRALYLRLGNNQFEGTIPGNVDALRRLKYLELQHNRLHGPLPAALARVPGLLRLCVEGNGLQGALPEAFRDLRFLQTLTCDPAQRRDHCGRAIPDAVYARGGGMVVRFLNGNLPEFLARAVNGSCHDDVATVSMGEEKEETAAVEAVVSGHEATSGKEEVDVEVGMEAGEECKMDEDSDEGKRAEAEVLEVSGN